MFRRLSTIRCSAVVASVGVQGPNAVAASKPAPPPFVTKNHADCDYVPPPAEVAPADPNNFVPVTLEDHAFMIGLKGKDLRQVQLSEVKLSYLMQCRRNQREKFGEEHLERLGDSYQIVAVAVTRNGEHVTEWSPGATAMEMMENVKEARQIKSEALLLGNVWVGISLILGSIVVAWIQMTRQREDQPEMQHHIAGDTQLPWWGNDAEYERSVKRLYLEEWRKARSAARRGQTFQEGIARESLFDDKRRVDSDLKIFDVSPEHLAALRERVNLKRNL
eukprot:PhM_4_TR17276/c0_g1_i1/m.52588